MPEQRSYSQASQDLFALGVLGYPSNGLFLDIGCGDPLAGNNTAWMEALGWTGISIDRGAARGSIEWDSERKTRFVQEDARSIKWRELIRKETFTFEYLSLDIDDDTLAALKRIPLDRLTFKVATIEHNAYIDGGVMRDAIREIMLPAGYVLVCSNVHLGTSNFEDWWLHNSIYDPAKHPRVNCLTHEDTIAAFFSKEPEHART